MSDGNWEKKLSQTNGVDVGPTKSELWVMRIEWWVISDENHTN